MECLEPMGELHSADILVQSVLPCQFIRPGVPKQETVSIYSPTLQQPFVLVTEVSVALLDV